MRSPPTPFNVETETETNTAGASVSVSGNGNGNGNNARYMWGRAAAGPARMASAAETLVEALVPGGLDGVAVALAALFRHRYGAALDGLVAWLAAHPRRYTAVVFLAALAREPSVVACVKAAGGAFPARRAAKLATFLPALRGAVEQYLANALSLAAFEAAAAAAWTLA